MYVSTKEKKLVNRGFMRGPFLPIYGSGAIVMLVVSAPFQSNLLLTYISGVIGATLLEYVTGVCMEAIFKVRYWDYSNKRFNFQGHICLGSSIAWGFLTIFMTHVIHRPIAAYIQRIPGSVLTIFTMLLTIVIVADFAISFQTAMDLRNVLIAMEKGREELQRIQRRLDVIIAVMDDTKEEFLSTIDSREMITGIEDRLAKVKKAIHERPSKYLESIRDEVSELRGRFSMQTYNRAKHVAADFHKRNLILGNPTMSSRRYNDMLKELKAEISIRKQQKKDAKHKKSDS